MIDYDEINQNKAITFSNNVSYLMELEILTERHFMLTPSILLEHVKCLSGLGVLFVLDLRIQ